jgi:hypothetical protein
MFFFLGQAAGPVVYGLGLYTIGVNAVFNRMGLRPANAAAGFGDLAAAAIGGDALVWHPDAFRQFADLPEHIDRHSAARIPIAADP